MTNRSDLDRLSNSRNFSGLCRSIVCCGRRCTLGLVTTGNALHAVSMNSFNSMRSYLVNLAVVVEKDTVHSSGASGGNDERRRERRLLFGMFALFVAARAPVYFSSEQCQEHFNLRLRRVVSQHSTLARNRCACVGASENRGAIHSPSCAEISGAYSTADFSRPSLPLGCNSTAVVHAMAEKSRARNEILRHALCVFFYCFSVTIVEAFHFVSILQA